MKDGSNVLTVTSVGDSKDSAFSSLSRNPALNSLLIDKLETDRWMREDKILKLLALFINDPKLLLQELVLDGRLERDHRGDICIPSVCWLKHTITTVYGAIVENVINQHGYPSNWDEKEPTSDPTDKGIWQPNTEKLQQWKQKQQVARRSRQYA